MTTEQTAKQLRLAADILETRHSWEHSDSSSRWVSVTNEDAHPLKVLADGREIRLVLATPPDNRPLHNPDNLTAEQVGAGWRLLAVGEEMPVGYEYWSNYDKKWCNDGMWTGHIIPQCNASTTCRLPLSTPWPDPRPDPYAELKQAHKEGKVIQCLIGSHWVRAQNPVWEYPLNTYRIKPEEPVVCAVSKPLTPPFTLPPPPPGMQWHREDGWTAEMLPQGYRPLLADETVQKTTDQFKINEAWEGAQGLAGMTPYLPDHNFFRTTRPLTFTHEGKTWTWHRPGDPMPCDGKRKIECVFADYTTWTDPSLVGVEVRWTQGKCDGDIIGWRYTDEPKTQVPLGPEDVPPGSAIRTDGEEIGWYSIACVNLHEAVLLLRNGAIRSYAWHTLKNSGQINRSLPLTGKWNPDAWEPCHKPG